MRKLNPALCFILLLLFPSATVFANTEPIIGHWKCLAITQDGDITPIPTSQYTSIVFESNNDYSIELGNDVQLTGTWEYFDFESENYDASYILKNDDDSLIVAFYANPEDAEAQLYIIIEDIMLYCTEDTESGSSKVLNSSDSNNVSSNKSGSYSASATTGEKNALEKAKSYLSISAFSYTGLIDQLEYSGFSTKEATYAADHCGANWNEQALKKAKSYISVSSFSYDGLVDQLEYSGFTHEQAVYGASRCGLSESDAAFEKAKSYLSVSAFSYTGLIEQLEYSGFSHTDAVNAADKCGADWYEQAAKKAASYLSISSFSRSDLISQLEYSGFTHDQAVYGATQNGY